MKTIAFINIAFPTMSETFVVNQMVSTIETGYKVINLVKKKNKITYSSNRKLVEKHNLLNFTHVYIPKLPKNKLYRVTKALFLLVINFRYFKSFFKTLNYKKYGKESKNLVLWFKVAHFIKHRNADVYHAQFGESGNYIALMKELGLTNAKIITTFHGYDAHFNKNTFLKMEASYNRLFRVGDIFTVNNYYLKNRLIKLGCNDSKIKTIPMGIDIDLFKPTVTKKKEQTTFQLLSVGRLIAFKGHHLGIRAVKKLLELNYDVCYFIIGEGNKKKELLQLIEDLNLKNNVFILGALSQNEIINYMRQSDLYLMTSVNDETGRRETQGVVTAEAQAIGLPVVAFDSGGVKYTIEKDSSGFLVEENNIEDYVSKIKILIDNPIKREAMGVEARKFVMHNFNKENMIKDFINLYE